jgi:N-glycosylase/DNA lyase
MVSTYPEKIYRVADFNLSLTLKSGQAFCWRQIDPEWWQGWIGGQPVWVRQQDDRVHVAGAGISENALRHYFQWDADLAGTLAAFPKDEWLRQSQIYCAGLRIMRQDPWETTANFICSALKQIVQIEQINQNLRQRLGIATSSGLHAFPLPSVVAEAGEAELRLCKLGFRARHLARASKQIASGEISLKRVEDLPTPEAREYLQQIAGVGEKVANCILLFAYGRREAFPIDVWVERILRRFYFQKRRKVTSRRLREFAASYFGPQAGYAQQYLFHWVRSNPRVISGDRPLLRT